MIVWQPEESLWPPVSWRGCLMMARPFLASPTSMTAKPGVARGDKK